MAWQEFSHNELDCYTGDSPWDEFGLALSRIAADYQERYGRKPRIIELLYALEISVSNQNVFDIGDNERLKLEYRIVSLYEQSLIDTTQPKRKINLEVVYKFEGVYTDRTDPGYYLIIRTSELIVNPKEEDCIEIPRLEVAKNILVCDFKILVDDLDNEDVHQLIRKYLLEKFSDNYYKDKASMIKFTNIVSGETCLGVMEISEP
jgi:hypothetical protein